MSYSTQGKTQRNLVVSSSSSPASAASVPVFDPVDSRDDSPRRAVGLPSGNKGMLALNDRPGHGVVGHPSGKNSRYFHTLGYENIFLQKSDFLHTQKILFHTLKNNFIPSKK
jgi:hypothetical protein